MFDAQMGCGGLGRGLESFYQCQVFRSASCSFTVSSPLLWHKPEGREKRRRRKQKKQTNKKPNKPKFEPLSPVAGVVLGLGLLTFLLCIPISVLHFVVSAIIQALLLHS